MTPEFRVAEGWPLERVDSKVQAQAVRALVANHTLIVGQSRSGKTNAARRLIEEILTWTKTRVIILDPNADFRWLAQPKGAEKQFARRWRRISQQIGIAAPDGEAWGIHWSKLSMEEMAAFVRATPKETFAEYRHLDRHLNYEKEKSGRVGTLREFIKSHYFEVAVGEESERYRLLLQELSNLKVWAVDTKKDLDSLLKAHRRAVVVDLSIDNDQVRTITAARALEALGRQGEEKRKKFVRGGDDSAKRRGRQRDWIGTLVVIDEGHLFAPPQSEDPQKRLVCERIKRFADQGKKLNLYLMVITQQPGKFDRDVLSECTNRIIMRVNERRSLRMLEQTYGGLPGAVRRRFDVQRGRGPGRRRSTV